MTIKVNLITFCRSVLLVTLIALSSCVSSKKYLTSPFSEIEIVPEGKAIVYLFKTPGYYGVGKFGSYLIYANGEPVNDLELSPGGYLIYYADPGVMEFSAKIPLGYLQLGIINEWTKISVDIKAGQTYFIQAAKNRFIDPLTGQPSLLYDDLAIPTLIERNSDEAINEINVCKLIAK